MSGPPQPPPDTVKANGESFVIEAFTLLGFGIAITALRTYARVKTVGFRKLEFDELFAWLAVGFKIAETGIAYTLGQTLRGLGNTQMSPAHRANLDPDSEEYRKRTLGAKLPIVAWVTYSAALWSLKAAVLIFYTRLTARLGRGYQIRLHIGTGFIVISYVAIILCLFTSCRPLHRFWQINPDPGNFCYAGESVVIVTMVMAFNIATDLYLLIIPMPMLWTVRMKFAKKCSLVLLFSGGVLIITFAALRCTAILSDPGHGGRLAGLWSVRETFVAIVTTNMPIIFPLINTWLWPWFGNWMTSMGYSNKTSDKREQSELGTLNRPQNVGGSGVIQKPAGTHHQHHTWNNISSDSEENIIRPGQV